MISLKTIAFKGAPKRIHDDARSRIKLLFNVDLLLTEKPDVLFFLTGGSEAEAVQCLDHNKFQILIASGKSNALASAMEVKAFANKNGFKTALLCLDDGKDKVQFENYLQVLNAFEALRGQRLGLIGHVSDWLVSSDIESGLLKEKLGIELVHIPWNEAGDFRELDIASDFMSRFHAGRQYNLEDASRVSELLKKIIDDHSLNAITVECFSLVQDHDVTACLGLSFLNDLGIPAGCEGDICSIAGMMLLKELTGETPWMANVACIIDNEVLFAHCTAPTNMLSEYHINTHFETGKGTAIHGRFNDEEVTVFRLNNTLDRAFIARGKIVDGRYEKNACRTQLHVEFEDDVIAELKSNPLGNHHLVMRGNYTYDLQVTLKNSLDKEFYK